MRKALESSPKNIDYVAKLSGRDKSRVENFFKKIGHLKGLPDPKKFGFLETWFRQEKPPRITKTPIHIISTMQNYLIMTMGPIFN